MTPLFGQGDGRSWRDKYCLPGILTASARRYVCSAQPSSILPWCTDYVAAAWIGLSNLILLYWNLPSMYIIGKTSATEVKLFCYLQGFRAITLHQESDFDALQLPQGIQHQTGHWRSLRPSHGWCCARSAGGAKSALLRAGFCGDFYVDCNWSRSILICHRISRPEVTSAIDVSGPKRHENEDAGDPETLFFNPTKS